MLDALSEKLQAALRDAGKKGRLEQADIDATVREIKLALLEADVNFKVVKSFTAAVKEACLESELEAALNPGQQVVKIVAAELEKLLGGSTHTFALASKSPTVILLAGLQGAGKTTTAAKLAAYLSKQNSATVALAACDVYRPAAIDQLIKVGGQVGATVYHQKTESSPVKIAQWALQQAKDENKDVLIVDTSGRLHIDQDLMQELADIKQAVKPNSVLFVVDAMTGQEAANVAKEFAEVANFDGVIMSKLDGDARGGAALSVASVSGKPIMFAGTGERLDQFDVFHPERMTQRILGMGDVMTLIEKAEGQFSEDQAKELERKIRKSQFTLEDFLQQMRMMRKMGPFSSLLKMIPGFSSKMGQLNIDERELDRVEAVILSMTPGERANPEIINGSRRRRIAAGAGTDIQAVRRLVKQFDQMRKMMKGVMQGKTPDLTALMRQHR